MGNPGEDVATPSATPRSFGEETTQAELDHDVSSFEPAAGHHDVERYEAALLKLAPRDRRAVRGRFEEQQSYESLAQALHLATATAARAVVVRAVGRLIEVMSR